MNKNTLRKAVLVVIALAALGAVGACAGVAEARGVLWDWGSGLFQGVLTVLLAVQIVRVWDE
jgi:hypothetical protein